MRMDTALTTVGRAVLFAHWPVPAAQLRPHLPEALELDTHEGSAWASVLAFEVAEARPRALPAGLSPTGAFGEATLRTYVRHDGAPGVYFLSLDAGTRVGAAALQGAMGMPCYHAETTVDIDERDGVVRSVSFRSRRSQAGQPPATLRATYGPDGEPAAAEPGSLAEFCVERRRWFTDTGKPSPYLSRVAPGLRVGEIDRDPWRVAPAEATVERNSLGRALGIDLDGPPTAQYSPGFESAVTTRR